MDYKGKKILQIHEGLIMRAAKKFNWEVQKFSTKVK